MRNNAENLTMINDEARAALAAVNDWPMTALDYLRRFEPWVVDGMHDPVNLAREEQPEAAKIAERFGIAPVFVSALPEFREAGYDMLAAYPARVWAEHFAG